MKIAPFERVHPRATNTPDDEAGDDGDERKLYVQSAALPPVEILGQARDVGIARSMGSQRDCYDNAVSTYTPAVVPFSTSSTYIVLAHRPARGMRCSWSCATACGGLART